MIMVSACLCGVNCKYNGGNNNIKEIEKLLKNKKVIFVCPEQLGGLQTPRSPSEIVGGTGIDVLNKCAKVLNKEKVDLTRNFLKGAEEVLNLAKKVKPELIILKANSPSCGKGSIYDGSFSKKKIPGNGVTSELLIKNGFNVIDENEYLQLIK